MTDLGQKNEIKIVKGPFLSAEYQLRNIWDWNKKFDWGFISQDFRGLDEIPPLPEGRLPAIVANVQLGNDQLTFETAWERLAHSNPLITRDETVMSDPCHLSVIGKQNQRGLSWVAIDFGSYWDPQVYEGPAPRKCRTDCEAWPAAEILWMGAHSPQWIRAMDGREVPYVYLPGYRVSPGTSPPSWMRVMYLAPPIGRTEPYLSTAHESCTCLGRAVPKYLK